MRPQGVAFDHFTARNAINIHFAPTDTECLISNNLRIAILRAWLINFIMEVTLRPPLAQGDVTLGSLSPSASSLETENVPREKVDHDVWQGEEEDTGALSLAIKCMLTKP